MMDGDLPSLVDQCSMKPARTLAASGWPGQRSDPPGSDDLRLATGEVAEVPAWVVEAATPGVRVRCLSALASAAGIRCPSGS